MTRFLASAARPCSMPSARAKFMSAYPHRPDGVAALPKMSALCQGRKFPSRIFTA
jgi:hypothetical protein